MSENRSVSEVNRWSMADMVVSCWKVVSVHGLAFQRQRFVDHRRAGVIAFSIYSCCCTMSSSGDAPLRSSRRGLSDGPKEEG